MSSNQSRGLDLHFTVPFEGTRQSNPVVRLDVSQIQSLATVLSRVFHDEPNFTYVMPDEQARRMVLPWFFRSVAIRTSRLYGEIYTTETIDGGALWISPGSGLTFERMARTAMIATPFNLEWATFRRCINLGARVEDVRERLARGPHWYLMALGVEPSKESTTIGGALIEPVLSRADSDGLPCYLETFHERNLPFYETRGFRIAGAGHIPGGGPNFWAMMRTPHQ